MSLPVTDIEQLVLGTVFKFGSVPAQYLMQEGLTHDRFSPEHAHIWRAIVEAIASKVEPIPVNVAGDHALYRALADQLEEKYAITDLSQVNLEHWGQEIYTAGELRAITPVLRRAAKELEDLDALVAATPSASDYLGNLIGDLYTVQERPHLGYSHVQEAVTRTRAVLERMERGESVRVVPCGWPTVRFHNLFPIGRMSVIHGEPSAGKTALTLQVLLGTAIQLKAHGLEGCVVMNSLEMDEESLMIRLACLLASVDFTTLENATGPKSLYRRLDSALDFVCV